MGTTNIGKEHTVAKRRIGMESVAGPDEGGEPPHRTCCHRSPETAKLGHLEGSLKRSTDRPAEKPSGPEARYPDERCRSVLGKGRAPPVPLTVVASRCPPGRVPLGAGTAAGAERYAARPMREPSTKGRPDEAYKLLSSEAKRRHLARRIPTDGQRERARNEGHLPTRCRAPRAIPSSLPRSPSPKGDQIVLLYEEGHWRFDGSAINLYGQVNPHQAVEAFLRGVRPKELRRDAPLRADSHMEGSMPTSSARSGRGAQKDEMLRITAALKGGHRHRANSKRSATEPPLAYGSGGTVQLVREHGVWKIRGLRLTDRSRSRLLAG